MSFYTVPKTINWTLTDAHAADLCLNEVEGGVQADPQRPLRSRQVLPQELGRVQGKHGGGLQRPP